MTDEERQRLLKEAFMLGHGVSPSEVEDLVERGYTIEGVDQWLVDRVREARRNYDEQTAGASGRRMAGDHAT